jgi:hypothetical protein
MNWERELIGLYESEAASEFVEGTTVTMWLKKISFATD